MAGTSPGCDDGPMLADAPLQAFVPATDLDRAADFYLHVLGLNLVERTPIAVVVDAAGVTVRITAVPDHRPPPGTTIGWVVDDATAAARWLADQGVVMQRFDGMDQDDDGLWTAPSGDRVGWFADPDGNTLSITESG